jgi:hypothetical protein
MSGGGRARKFGPDLAVALIKRQLGLNAPEAVSPNNGLPDAKAVSVFDG